MDIKEEELINIIKEFKSSRYPVYEKEIDNVVGILYAKGHLHLQNGLRQPYFIPEIMVVDDLFEGMHNKKIHFTSMIDEFSTVSDIIRVIFFCMKRGYFLIHQ